VTGLAIAIREISMGWATRHIECLRNGQTVTFRPIGHSMSGRIESGQLCTVEPAEPASLAVGDIVLCTVAGQQYLHLVQAIQGGRFLIGNNHGHTNGWVGPAKIHGKCVGVA
jgi:hypothetical protein